jgi:Fur family ferric uptake transcriptional regulator
MPCAGKMTARSARDRTRDDVEKLMAVFRERLRKRGLKPAAQRDNVALTFFKLGRPISAEKLYVEVKKVNPYAGQATVYRTLRLLKECELVYERYFSDGKGRYEIVNDKDPRHQFICDRCGRIIEFHNARLERVRFAVARELGVLLGRQKIELFGLCPRCLKNERRHNPVIGFFQNPQTRRRAPTS